MNGQYDPRHETVWRLGIITYYLLTGCRPYEDGRQALLRPYGEPTHLKHFSTGTALVWKKIKQDVRNTDEVNAEIRKASADNADFWR